MKKLVAILLTGCMTFQSLMGSVVPIQAASNAAQVTTVETPLQEEEITLQEEATEETTVEDSDTEKDEPVFEEEEISPDTEITVEEITEEAPMQEERAGAKKSKKDKKNEESVQSAKGGLDVSINSSLLSKQNSGVEVEIKKGTDSHELQMNFEEKGIRGGVSFTDLEPGSWSVTVRAPKFAHYTQTVEVGKQQTSQIQLNSEQTATKGPGVLYLGDVDNDGAVTGDDKELMVKYLHQQPEEVKTQNLNYDLNGDGQADLADLQHIARNMGKEPVQSKVETLIYSAGIELEETKTGTQVSGSVSDVLGNTGSMKLELTDGAEISEEAPVEVAFTLPEDAPKMEGITIQAPVTSESGEITSDIKSGVVIVEAVDGSQHEFALNDTSAQRVALFAARSAGVTVGADGSLNLNFGSKIAVKKVTIKITGTTKKEEPLVEISKVEFLNNMESKIPAPELNIPGELKAVAGNRTIDLSWQEQTNVTGYEIYAEGNVGKKGNSKHAEGILNVASNSHEMTVITDEQGESKSLINNEEYTIKVRSVNGEWKSPWSEEIKAVPKPSGVPPRPDNVKAEGRYRAIDVNWKQMEDTDSYMVYYREKGQEEFQQVPEENLTRNTYTITGLKDGTVYDVKVRGYNDNGWGPDSETSSAETVTKPTPELPKFQQINTMNEEGINKTHITNAMTGTSGKMVGSLLDSGNSAWGLIDNNYGSYWYKSDWDDGVAYPTDDKGVKITFDQPYKMSYITFAAMNVEGNYKAARVRYWEDLSESYKEVGVRLAKKMDKNQNPYYLVKFDEVVDAQQIQLFLQNGPRDLKIAEMHFHEDDGLELEIMGLYEDEAHTTLKKEVTDARITELENKLEEVDEKSKEKHPAYDELKLELKTIREIFEGRLAPAVEVNNQITGKKDGHLGFGGLNAWQPLGYTTYAGERLTVQVGHNTKKTGMSAELQLIVTQNHAEAGSFAQIYNLKVGKNELTVPSLQSIDVEKGGQLYIAYTGNNSSDEYAVRIQGGTKIPVLDVYKKTPEERSKAIEAYVKELEAYVEDIEADHEKLHNAEDSNKTVKYQYDEKNCILNTTDIMMESMMYSVPATQIWKGIKDAQDKAAHLDQSLKSMEDMMTLFYQHKGLNDDGGANNALPSQHLNIRYMRMFAGAFMYAGGNHIGVEFDQTDFGNKSQMNSFGWGIAHEIGHNINQGTYAVAEVTNNYYAQLLTKRQRYEDAAVYEKVTSGTIGDAPSVFIQLAMYWQLHLAYDDNKEDHAIYDNYQEQFDNLFFARMDTYARDPKAAPKGGLDLTDGKDQSLMRLACAAAEANIIPFFERWGKVPNQKTRDYAAQYGEPTEKALYYVNQKARDYRVDHEDAAGIEGQDVATAKVSNKSNQVEVEIRENAGVNRDLILGYEIVRSMTSNGQPEAQVIGFIPVDQSKETTVFTDTVSSINNRVMNYEVRPVDKLLNYGASAQAGSVKIETEGRLSKTEWTVETNMVSEDDTVITPNEDDPDSGSHENGALEPDRKRSIERVIDNNDETIYKGRAEGTGEIIIDMHKTETVAALQYKGDLLGKVTVEISRDGQNWETVKKDYDNLNASTSADGAYRIWFNDEDTNTVKTYEARYVKLIIPESGEHSIGEIEICGPSGDNMEFYKAGEQAAVGILKDDFVLDASSEDVIPQGSLIFTGIYKGNPAYNVPLLYDEEGNVVGAHVGADGEITVEGYSVLFAEDPEDGDLGETSEGIWVYYLEPGKWSKETLPKKVRGELYRVNDAMTNEGERIVSDTTLIELPEELPEITLKADNEQATRQK